MTGVQTCALPISAAAAESAGSSQIRRSSEIAESRQGPGRARQGSRLPARGGLFRKVAGKGASRLFPQFHREGANCSQSDFEHHARPTIGAVCLEGSSAIAPSRLHKSPLCGGNPKDRNGDGDVVSWGPSDLDPPRRKSPVTLQSREQFFQTIPGNSGFQAAARALSVRVEVPKN